MMKDSVTILLLFYIYYLTLIFVKYQTYFSIKYHFIVIVFC